MITPIQSEGRPPVEVKRETDHATLPWLINLYGPSQVEPEKFDVGPIGYVDDVARVTGKANAEFICRACNSFYEMREALNGILENYIELKRITLHMAKSDAPNWIGKNLTVDDDIHVIAARAAIAKATK